MNDPKITLDRAVANLLAELADLHAAADYVPENDDYRRGWRTAVANLRTSGVVAQLEFNLEQAGWQPPRSARQWTKEG